MKDKQLDTASFFGRVASLILLGFFVERVATAYLGSPWGAALTIVAMLAILAGVILWPRLKRKDAEEEPE
jgi:membrane protein DedA with SNARE-associated domain